MSQPESVTFAIAIADPRYGEWLATQNDQSISTIVYNYYLSYQKALVNQVVPKPKTAIEKRNTQSSYSAGLAGEEAVISALSPVYELDIKSSGAGDMIAKRFAKSVMVEVKNYATAVPYKEVEKFYRDLDANPSIEGGFIFDINDFRLDASIATQLKKVKQQFIDKNRRIV